MKRKQRPDRVIGHAKGQELRPGSSSRTGQLFTFTSSGNAQMLRINPQKRSRRNQGRKGMPPEVWHKIFSFLDTGTVLSSVSLASKAWRVLSMKQMRSCYLSCSEEDVPKVVKILPRSITELDLSSITDVTGALIRRIGIQLPSLRRLKIKLPDTSNFLRQNRQGSILHNLMNAVYALPHLHSLSLCCSNAITERQLDTLLQGLKQQPQHPQQQHSQQPQHSQTQHARNFPVHSLEISLSDAISTSHLENLNPSVKQLILRNCFFLPDTVLEVLPRTLTMLKLVRGGPLNESVLANHLPSYQNLLSLGISFSVDLSDETIARLPRSLRYLNIFGACSTLSNDAMKALPPQLRTLHMSYNHRVTDEGLTLLPSTLQYVTLVSFACITIEGLERGLPRGLVTVNLWGTLDASVRLDDYPFLAAKAIREAPYLSTSLLS